MLMTTDWPGWWLLRKWVAVAGSDSKTTKKLAASMDSSFHKRFLCSMSGCLLVFYPQNYFQTWSHCFINRIDGIFYVLWCHFNKLHSTSTGVDAISRNHSLCSPTRSNSSPVQVLSWDCNNSVTSWITVLPRTLVLLLFPPHLQLLPPLKFESLRVIPESWNQLLPNTS